MLVVFTLMWTAVLDILWPRSDAHIHYLSPKLKKVKVKTKRKEKKK